MSTWFFDLFLEACLIAWSIFSSVLIPCSKQTSIQAHMIGHTLFLLMRSVRDQNVHKITIIDGSIGHIAVTTPCGMMSGTSDWVSCPPSNIPVWVAARLICQSESINYMLSFDLAKEGEQERRLGFDQEIYSETTYYIENGMQKLCYLCMAHKLLIHHNNIM